LFIYLKKLRKLIVETKYSCKIIFLIFRKKLIFKRRDKRFEVILKKYL